MNMQESLAEEFEVNRAHLRAVAYRMLGSLSEADDAVQMTWLRLSRADTSSIDNIGGWLTTVAARVCLDMLRARKARREESFDAHMPEANIGHENVIDPEQEALLADAVGLALLVVLGTLNPAERIAFVLHDIFDLPFEEIAPIVERTPAAARKLASRARQRVRGAATVPAAELAQQRSVIDAFLAASRAGDFAGLLAVLDPDVVVRADSAGLLRAGGAKEVRGAEIVAKQFTGRAQAARPMLVDGAAGVVVAPHGQLFLVLLPTIVDGKITVIDVISDPVRLHQLNLAVLDG